MTFKVALFHNLAQFESVSMRRFAEELSLALKTDSDGRWAIEDIHCEQPHLLQTILPLRQGARLASSAGLWIKYPWLASTIHADVFHIPDLSHSQLTLGVGPERCIVTCHDIIQLLAAKGELGIKPSTFLTPLTIRIRLALASRCAKIITVSSATKKDLVRLAQIPEDKIEVIPVGLNPVFKAPPDPQASKIALRESLSLPADAKIVLHIGADIAYKNIAGAIRTFALIKQALPHAYFVKAGEELSNTHANLLRELGLEANYRYTGKLSDNRLTEVYAGADLLLFPSLYEGFGWPTIEAMSCGLPVVCANAGALPEAVGNAALSAAPDNYDDLASACTHLLTDDNARAEIISRGFNHARQFTWQRCARSTFEVYEQVLKATRRRG